MEFLKIGSSFRRKGRKKAEAKEEEGGGGAMPDSEESRKAEGEVIMQNGEGEEEEEDDDDDFITEEVKRRLKELRKSSFMVLIPEEECLKDEDGDGDGDGEEGSTSSGWREEGEQEGEEDEGCGWCGFDAFYEDYCQRMVFFDKMAKQLMESPESRHHSIQSPKSVSKKVASAFWNLKLKRKDLNHDVQHLELEQPVHGPYENLETVYVAHICLSWEALHFQYKHLSQKISSECPTSCCYGYACQAFQQFQVLLQRFLENEPFEDGSRFESYARARKSFPLFLQIPRYQDLEMKKEDEGSYNQPIPATDLLKIMEDSVVTFHHFLKLEKNSRPSHMFGGHIRAGKMLQVLQNSLSKKEAKFKELYKKKRNRQKECSPRMGEEIDLLFALIDIKIVSRVLKMDKISQQHLLWCEEKMSKLDVSGNHLHRHASPGIFPC